MIETTVIAATAFGSSVGALILAIGYIAGRKDAEARCRHENERRTRQRRHSRFSPSLPRVKDIAKP